MHVKFKVDLLYFLKLFYNDCKLLHNLRRFLTSKITKKLETHQKIEQMQDGFVEY